MTFCTEKYQQSQSAQVCQNLSNSGFGSSGNQLLAAAGAYHSENAGGRCANTYSRGTGTSAYYGFPLLRLFGFPFCGNNAAPQNIKPNFRDLATQKLHGCWCVLIPMLVRIYEACMLAKEYKVRQRLVEGY